MKTLAMIKMEKNFIAHIDKKRPRKPYETCSLGFLLRRLYDESTELARAIWDHDVENAKLECADVSNTVDYIFERLQQEAEKQEER